MTYVAQILKTALSNVHNQAVSSPPTYLPEDENSPNFWKVVLTLLYFQTLDKDKVHKLSSSTLIPYEE
jgi:hypothetical protein